jgi:hypothetical protein
MLAVAGCATHAGGSRGRPELVVGSGPESESMLLAGI